MKATLALLVVVAILAVVLVRATGAFDSHTAFSQTDEIRLRDAHPGGVFLDDHTYRACERGYFARFLADGTYLTTNTACWK